MIKKTKLTGLWSFKLSVYILIGYFCVLFPFIQFVLRDAMRKPALGYLAYCGAALLLLLFLRKATLTGLGFGKENILQNILIGGISGGAIFISLPLLDGFIDLSGLGDSALFAGAEERSGSGGTASLMAVLITVLAAPAIEQTFFSGFVLQSLLKKFRPVTAIYLGALVFTLAHFNFQLSAFAIGLITASFFYITGSLYAPILFQAACHAGGLMIELYYPRLVTLLGFLF